MHNSVYAFDADQPALGAYWQKSMDNGAETSVPSSDVAGTDHNMYPEIGIVSTPVIDKGKTNTIYLVAMTKLASPLTYTHRLHALDLSTGAEKFNGPVQISYPGGTVGSSTYPAFVSMHSGDNGQRCWRRTDRCISASRRFRMSRRRIGAGCFATVRRIWPSNMCSTRIR